jgi:hypothetical protein
MVNPADVKLMHGRVQSGKTAGILSFCHKSVNKNHVAVVILRNYLADLEQFKRRARASGLSCVERSPKPGQVYVLIGNNSRYHKAREHFRRNRQPYTLAIDECDLMANRHSRLEHGASEVYKTTATPSESCTGSAGSVEQTTPSDDYYGIDRLRFRTRYSIHEAVKKISRRENHITLIIAETRIHRQTILADSVNKMCARSPKDHVTLTINSFGTVLKYGDRKVKLGRMVVSQALQYLKDNNYPKRVFIVSGLVMRRGVSIVSQDYRWHITDQILYPGNKNITLTNLYQYCRILGIFRDNPVLTMYCSKHTRDRLRTIA